MQITASLVNELRSKTGVGMMQCKKALTETDGDIEKAIDLLRKQGAAVAAKRADKAANEGVVVLGKTEGKVVMAELNCETDFVANSDDFKVLSAAAIQAMLNQDLDSAEAVVAAEVEGETIGSRLDATMGKIGEKISIRRVATVQVAANEVAFPYTHLGGKAGCIARLSYEGSVDEAELEALAKDVAMQAVAFEAVSLDESGVPAEIIEKERAIYREQIEAEGKTKPEFIDRQVDGRVKKFLKGICLLEQGFLRDTQITVAAHIASETKRLGLTSLKVEEFVRFELGK